MQFSLASISIWAQPTCCGAGCPLLRVACVLGLPPVFSLVYEQPHVCLVAFVSCRKTYLLFQVGVILRSCCQFNLGVWRHQTPLLRSTRTNIPLLEAGASVSWSSGLIQRCPHADRCALKYIEGSGCLSRRWLGWPLPLASQGRALLVA